MNNEELNFWVMKIDESLAVYTPTDPSQAHCLHSGDPLTMNREIDDSRYALDHILKKQFMLKSSLYTKGSQILGERRSAFMRNYIDQLITELSV